MTLLLDTSALLVLYREEPEVDQVLALFDDPQHDILLSSNQFLQLFSRVVSVDEAVARASLRLVESIPLRLPIADSLIAASALVHEACLVHKDKHMAIIPPEVLPTLNLAQP